MTAVDPTYPLFPVASILSSALLLLILLTSFVRQSWNLGIAFLCFWLFWDNLVCGINAIVWSDNYKIKLYVYCDIVTRLRVVVFVVRPMCTLLITRRLYLIASLRSVELPNTREKRKNAAIEWTLGLVIPLVVAGPIYYAIQSARFLVLEGAGCQSSSEGSILDNLLIDSWNVLPPLISTLVYYPKVIWVFYRQRRDTNRFLQSNDSVSRTNYFRILALASIDVIFTLPIGIFNIVLGDLELNKGYEGHIPFYVGWSEDHSDWAPFGVSYANLKTSAAGLAQLYFPQWTSPILALIIFLFFGLTAEARDTYWRALCYIGKRFSRKTTLHRPETKSVLGAMEFEARGQDASLDAELGSRPSFAKFEPFAVAKPGSADGESESAQSLRAPSNSGYNESGTTHIELRDDSKYAITPGHG